MGVSGLVWGFFVSTLLVLHATALINSLGHVWGTRRYATADGSRNNALLALLTLGEGWHNNHHYAKYSMRQVFFWWELDITYYTLCVAEWLGLIWDVRKPGRRALAGQLHSRSNGSARSVHSIVAPGLQTRGSSRDELTEALEAHVSVLDTRH